MQRHLCSGLARQSNFHGFPRFSIPSAVETASRGLKWHLRTETLKLRPQAVGQIRQKVKQKLFLKSRTIIFCSPRLTGQVGVPVQARCSSPPPGRSDFRFPFIVGPRGTTSRSCSALRYAMLFVTSTVLFSSLRPVLSPPGLKSWPRRLILTPWGLAKWSPEGAPKNALVEKVV